MDWTEKYRPGTLADIVGNGTAVRQVLDWARGWKRGAKPLLLYGKPGIGKTSAAYALAHDMQWDAMELNASDQRTKAVIERVAGAGSTSGSLTGAGRRLVILDEADNLQGTADKGGAKAILEIIREARQPMILIANDLYGVAPEIRSACEPVQFKALPARSLVPHLKYICAREKVKCSEAALHEVAQSASGDMRTAVTMLYAASIGRDHLDESDIRTSMKDERSNVFQLVSAVFGKHGEEDLVRMAYEVDDTPDSVVQWIESNIYTLGEPHAVAGAYQHLSRADEYIGYTYRQQYYTLWRYATVQMLLGTHTIAGGHGIHEKIASPRRWQKMASSRRQKAIRNAVLGKYAGMMHMPQQTVREGYLNLLSILAETQPLLHARKLDLDADQLTFLIHDRARATGIAKEVAVEKKEIEKIEKTRISKKAAAEQKKKDLEELEKKSQATAAASAETSQPPAEMLPQPDSEKKEKPGKSSDTQSTLF